MSSRDMNQNNIQIEKEPKTRPIVWTALITPLLDNNEIDYASLAKLAHQQSDAGNGILLLGSTGEGLALSNEEQLAIVTFVCELSLKAPIMVAVGGFNLAHQEAWIKQCNTLPIAAFLLGSPIYAKPGVVGQTHWFNTLLDAAEYPCMLYNVPSRSGTDIAVAALAELQHHKNCWALKEASGDINTFLDYRQHCPEVELYSGEDAMVPYLVAAGMKGLVSVSANVWPRYTHQYVEMALLNQHQSLFPVWHNAIKALFQVANPIPVKVLLRDLEQIQTATLRPPLIVEELSKTNNLMQIHYAMETWFEQFGSITNITQQQNETAELTQI